VSVILVGAGPGDADLLTLRAARHIASAQVVVVDRLVDPSVHDLIPLSAVVHYVGKTPGESHSQASINELLVRLGQSGQRVVRIKGGDPFLFGRGGEELIALHEAGVACDVVPGISSALAGPLAAGIPVTHRGVSRGVLVVTGHVADGEFPSLRDMAHPDISIVVLMGIAHRAQISRELVSGGLSPETPVAVVERAWTSSQRSVRGQLDGLAVMEVVSPAVIVIGPVAAMSLREISAQLAVAI
jgi:siroheme synthase